MRSLRLLGSGLIAHGVRRFTRDGAELPKLVPIELIRWSIICRPSVRTVDVAFQVRPVEALVCGIYSPLLLALSLPMEGLLVTFHATGVQTINVSFTRVLH